MKVVNKIQKESRMNPVYKIIKGVAAGVAIVAGLSVLGYCYHNHCDPKILIKTGCNGIIQQFPKYKIVTDLENGLVGTYHKKYNIWSYCINRFISNNFYTPKIW